MKEKGFVSITPLLIVVCVVCAVGGFILGRTSVLKNQKPSGEKANTSVQIAPNNTVPQSIVTSQSLTVNGTITSVGKDTITIKDAQGKNDTTLTLAPTFMLLTFPAKGAPTPQAVSDSSKIPTGTQAAITAVYGTNHQYQVTTIAITQESTPSASQPAK